jgi:ABC-type nitrate/sulfonate/bicarbonate transport system permease component
MNKILNSGWVRPFLLIVVMLILWDLAIRFFNVPAYLVPTPFSVVEQLWKEWPMLLKEVGPTTWATLGGFALSVLVGVPIAMLIRLHLNFQEVCQLFENRSSREWSGHLKIIELKNSLSIFSPIPIPMHLRIT